ncbi:MAG: hypothetical protein ABIR81_05515 [Ginsengibacter sp.]
MKKQVLYLAAAATAFMLFKLIRQRYYRTGELNKITSQPTAQSHHLTNVFSKAKVISQNSEVM